MPPIQAFATVIKAFDRQKLCLANHLICPFWGSWVQKVKGQIAAVVYNLLILAVLDPLIGPQKRLWLLDSILIPVTSTSESTRDIYKTKIPHVFCGWQSVASFPDSQCIFTWFIASLLVEPGNELRCKPNSGHIVMYPLLVVCCFQSRNCKQHLKIWIEARISFIASVLC